MQITKQDGYWLPEKLTLKINIFVLKFNLMIGYINRDTHLKTFH